jgi:hypothetical protein
MLRKRQEILSTNSLIIFAILYRKLSPNLAAHLFRSETVLDYNRKKPKSSIASLKHINRKKASILRDSLRSEFNKIETELKAEIIERINSDSGLSEEDRSMRIRSLDKFMAWVDERIWYLYYVINRTKSGERFKSDFASIFKVYLDNTQIAVHLGNLLMEFIQNAEKAHLTRLIHNFSAAPVKDTDLFLRSSTNRLKLIGLAERANELIDLSWNIHSSGNEAGNHFRLKIILSNFGLIDDRTRARLSRKMNASTEGLTLASFYKDIQSDEHLGAGLGLLYNSYLTDLCKRRGIFYTAGIFPEPAKEKTTIWLELNF